VITEGYLELGATSFCSGTDGDITCHLNFKETPDSAKNFTAYVSEGTGANQMGKLPRSYRREELRLRANDNSLVAPQDKVRITGDVISMNVGPGGENSCSITVKKIERR
jgi:hypothetical protein